MLPHHHHSDPSGKIDLDVGYFIMQLLHGGWSQTKIINLSVVNIGKHFTNNNLLSNIQRETAKSMFELEIEQTEVMKIAC
jgi:hypothetical protein